MKSKVVVSFGLLVILAGLAPADAHDVARDSNDRIRRQGLLGSIAEGVAEGLVEGLIIGNQYPSYYGGGYPYGGYYNNRPYYNNYGGYYYGNNWNNYNNNRPYNNPYYY